MCVLATLVAGAGLKVFSPWDMTLSCCRKLSFCKLKYQELLEWPAIMATSVPSFPLGIPRNGPVEG
eukprot:950959-Amphidinium_carterae.1